MTCVTVVYLILAWTVLSVPLGILIGHLIWLGRQPLRARGRR